MKHPLPANAIRIYLPRPNGRPRYIGYRLPDDPCVHLYSHSDGSHLRCPLGLLTGRDCHLEPQTVLEHAAAVTGSSVDGIAEWLEREVPQVAAAMLPGVE